MMSATERERLTAIAVRSAGQRYALPIEQVREIHQIVAFAEVPDETGTVLGMVDVRGEVVPAVDVRTLLGAPLEPHTPDSPMVIVTSGRGTVALVVDRVDAMFDVAADSLEPAPDLHPLSTRMLGACRYEEELIFFLDLETLLDPVDLVDSPGGGER